MSAVEILTYTIVYVDGRQVICEKTVGHIDSRYAVHQHRIASYVEKQIEQTGQQAARKAHSIAAQNAAANRGAHLS